MEKTIINENKLERLARETFIPDRKEVEAILAEAASGGGLTLDQTAILLAARTPAEVDLINEAAGRLKEKLFGKRVVLFAPLYLSNFCANGCLYCGFRASNTGVDRTALTPDQAVTEARALEAMGFKRVLLVTGEDPRYGIDYIASAIRAIYKETGIRIVHVNAPPMEAAALAELKKAGAGVYQSFQETYHRPTYSVMHPSGKKRDYDYRLSVMDRAMEAGFDDVGIGPLYGLYDPAFETLATIAHSRHLMKEFGTHAHTVSIPRLRPAEGSALGKVPYRVSDEELKKIVAVVRLAVPSAGVVVSTREPRALRSELIHVGATQLSAASRTNPGGYAGDGKTLEQFSTNDHRNLHQVIASVMDEGMLPSLCTTCYRVGRTGGNFTEKASSGDMEKFCQANAILTLKEYLEEHSGNGIDERGLKLIEDSVATVKDPALKKALAEKLERLSRGERDLFF